MWHGWIETIGRCENMDRCSVHKQIGIDWQYLTIDKNLSETNIYLFFFAGVIIDDRLNIY